MASRIPTEVRFMIWSHLLAINLAEEPRIYQLKRTKCEVTGAGQCKITVYGDNISQPVLLSIEREARRIAQPHYVRVSGVICGRRSASETSSSSSRAVAGGFWIRRKDIVYIDAAFSRTLPSIVRTNMAGIERIAVDVQVLDEKRRQHGHSMMDRVLTVFSSVKHVVFLAPTKPNKRGNYYKGLRLVDKEEAEDAKDLPMTRFYQAGGKGSGVVGSPWLGAAFFLNDILPGRPWLTNRLAPGDKFRRAVRRRRRDPIPVVIFQREGAREPQKMATTGPYAGSGTFALGSIHRRVRPEPISEARLMELVEATKITFKKRRN